MRLPTVTGGELVVRTLRQAGVTKIFGLHGAHIDGIFQACVDAKIPIVDTRHEAAAGHAAEGYARTANRLGVAVVTAGGGFTNVTTPLANAWLDRTPMLIIAGSGALRDTETNTLQAGIDQVAIATPITKWAHRILATEQIPRLITQAIRIATAGPRGPVLIDIPWDVLTNSVEDSAVHIPKVTLEVRGSPAPPAAVTSALELLRAAQRPLILVGSEMTRGNGGAALVELVERTGIPVFADYEAFSLLSSLPAYSGGVIQNLYTFKEHRPDVLLMLGLRFGLYTWHGSGVLLPKDAAIIQVDPDAREGGRLQSVALFMASDPAATTHSLARAAADRIWPDQFQWRSTVKREVDRRLNAVAAAAHGRAPLHPFRAVQKIAEFIGPQTVVVADGAESYLWLTEVISGTRPAAFLTHGFLGCMGVGMGNALGAQAAAPDKRVIFVVGDGSVGYGLAEFDSLQRHGLPVIVVILNNRSWGATLHFQQFMVGAERITNTRLDNGEYHDVARAFGAEGSSVTTLEQLDAAMRAALEHRRPACINVRVDRDPVPPEEMVLMGKDPFL